MKLDLTCPIEVRGYTLSYPDDVAQASVRLYNLTNRRIASFEAIAKWRSRASDRSIAMPFSAERLRAGGENGFRIHLTCDRLPDADRLEVVFTCVEFEDGVDDWRAGDGRIVEIAPIEPIAQNTLAALKASAGDDAVCFARQDESLWRCVCGRVNDGEACVRCHRSHHEAFRHTLESIASPADDAGQNPQDDEALMAEMYSTFLRQRNKLLRRTVSAIAAVVLALTALLLFSREPGKASHANAEVVSVYTQILSHQEDMP